ncbi:helix-turn-helix domain-containing protein [Streptomyces sp. NPDC006992]|uniref:tetratricopeptide repeat protein n=1 Tax=Streptomyces sp. NPDC006992 TaxID=3155601 RepID=UPI0033E25A28
MDEERTGRGPAVTELRRRLADGLAQGRLNQQQLAQRAGLGRTTVSEALSFRKPVPSAETVAALARALRLPVPDLLGLQRTAAQEAGAVADDGPGRPIGQWEPHDLEVHPAGPGTTAARSEASVEWALPRYVSRAHDRVLVEAVRDAGAGRSRIVVLVGTSSTGKTRSCWEAVQPLAGQGWQLWHPFHPDRAQAALEQLHHVRPRTVVWLNETQHYLGDRMVGEQIAAALHHLMVSPERGPVLVLGTLWPEYAAQYTALPAPDGADPHSRTRELLAGRTLVVPDAFDAPALAAAAVLAEGGDRLLADALIRARTDGRLTQDLAGAPELLNRFEHAHPSARAVLEAAMDARRLGVGLHLPQAFLTDAVTDYLGQSDYDQLTDDWAERAYAELAQPVHGKQAPLRRTNPRTPRRPPATPAAGIVAAQAAGPQFRLADYLEQHGRTNRRHLCPPASFWHAAHTHLTRPDDLHQLAVAADERHRLEWAHHLRRRAADHGSTGALSRLAASRAQTGDWDGAEALLRQAADHGSTESLWRLALRREQAGDRAGAEAVAQEAADRGDTYALYRMAVMREEAGDRDGAEALLRQAADLGGAESLYRLAAMREKAGDRGGAEALAQQAADHGDTYALGRLAVGRGQAGDRDGAEALARQTAAPGNTDALYRLAEIREEAGDLAGAEPLLLQAISLGSTIAWSRLAEMREKAGDPDGAEALGQQATAPCNTYVWYRLAEMREKAGDRDGAEALLRQAADHGHLSALHGLAVMREEAGDRDGAEALLRQAAPWNTYVWSRLVEMREKAGDREDAEALAQQAADHGDAYALLRLAVMREEAGDRDSAETLLRQAADVGITIAQNREELGRRWRYGLDPDGTPTPPWQPHTNLPHTPPDAP